MFHGCSCGDEKAHRSLLRKGTAVTILLSHLGQDGSSQLPGASPAAHSCTSATTCRDRHAMMARMKYVYVRIESFIVADCVRMYLLLYLCMCSMCMSALS